MKALSFLNWMILTVAVTVAVAGAVVCLLLLPFPRLSDHGSARFGDLALGTAVAAGVALTAALATWLVEKRHALFWLGQLLLLMALAGALVFILQLG